MTDRPIIFSGPMVRALLDGRKTQTRRILKPQPDPGQFFGHMTYVAEARKVIARNATGMRQDIPVPYAPGDRLWVREAWRSAKDIDTMSAKDMERECVLADYDAPWAPIQYEADGARDNWSHDTWSHCVDAGRYRHARFMPRWASRRTLHVTEVRVQRLQEISEHDAVCEGLPPANPLPCGGVSHMAGDLFCELWETLHGEGSWDANPWVCAISFTVQDANIDQARAAA